MIRLKARLKEALMQSGWKDEMKIYIERKISPSTPLSIRISMLYLLIELVEEQGTKMTLDELSKTSATYAYGTNIQSSRHINASFSFLSVVNIPDDVKIQILRQIRQFLRSELNKPDDMP
jgi:hypothetical protein